MFRCGVGCGCNLEVKEGNVELRVEVCWRCEKGLFGEVQGGAEAFDIVIVFCTQIPSPTETGKYFGIILAIL